MPTAIPFDGANCTYKHPDCHDLPAMKMQVPFGETKVDQVTACYQFSETELEELLKNGGKFFINVTYGWPPLSVTMTKPEVTVTMVEFSDVARRLKDELDTARITGHGSEGRVYLTFSDMQFDLSKEEWQHVQDLFAEL